MRGVAPLTAEFARAAMASTFTGIDEDEHSFEERNSASESNQTLVLSVDPFQQRQT